MNSNPFQEIPPVLRRRLYLGYALLVLALGAVATGYSAIGHDVPDLLKAVLAGMVPLSAIFQVAAASNVPKE